VPYRLVEITTGGKGLNLQTALRLERFAASWIDGLNHLRSVGTGRSLQFN